MASSVPTIPPQLSRIDFADRLCELFPPGWASVDAKLPGGIFYAVMATLAQDMGFLLGEPITTNIALAGTPTAGDILTVTFTNPNIPTPQVVSYRVAAGDTLISISAALAALISSNPALNGVGVKARRSGTGAVIVITYPNVPPNTVWTTAAPPLNTVVVGLSVSDDSTETLTLQPQAAPPTGALQYAAAATRVQTAMNGALDLAALDFLDNTFRLRVTGETDAAFRARVLAALLPSGATRAAVSAAVASVTGVIPRIIEPWRPQDTGVIDGVWVDGQLFGAMYLDIDTVETPARLTDPGLGYQGFIESILPGIPVLGGNPLPCLDDGMYTDTAGCSMFDFDESVPLGAELVYDAINAKKVYGTVAWVRFEDITILGGFVLPSLVSPALQGIIGLAFGPALAGQAAAGHAGVMTPEYGLEADVVGESIAALAGVLVAHFDCSIVLTGQSSVSISGVLGPVAGTIFQLSGLPASAQAGSVLTVFDFALTLSGDSVAALTGSFVARADGSITLTGRSAAAQNGTTAQQVIVPILGNSAAALAGALPPLIDSRLLVGVASLGMGALGELM